MYPTPTASTEDLARGVSDFICLCLENDSYEVLQVQCWVTVSISYSGSKVKSAVVAVPSPDVKLQAPVKVVLPLVDVAQLKTSFPAMFLRINEGPVSAGGGVVEPGTAEPGLIS